MNDEREFTIVENLLSPAEREWRRSVREWTDAEIMPHVEDAYEREHFPPAFAEKIGAQKWFGITLPARDGCGGRNFRDYGILCQEIERADSGVRSLISVQSSLAMYAIFRFGDDSQRKILAKMANGETLGCFALTEPGAGSDPEGMDAFAEKTSAGWLLNGHKRWVTAAPVANIAVVWAKTADGIRGFVAPTNAPGVDVRPLRGKLSLRLSPSAEIVFTNCELPDGALLPGSDTGLRAPLSCLTQARFGICWGALGAAARCYEIARAHCVRRSQFGRPLAGFQLVQQKLADIYADIARGQLLNIRLADMMQNGECRPEHISLGKRESCRTARRAARKCRDLLGAEGILARNEVMRHLANLETVYTYEGADHIHTLILGRHLTGENAFG
ncbi:MAG: acyl-CoA dehydrogenase family protein [Gammaproteobacteria bacterium]